MREAAPGWASAIAGHHSIACGQVIAGSNLRAWYHVSIISGAFAVAFLLGYNLSSQSGNEPGYFEATEAGAYGSVEKTDGPSGLNTEDSEYYKSLLNE
jgi:hypothetical protein